MPIKIGRRSNSTADMENPGTEQLFVHVLYLFVHVFNPNLILYSIVTFSIEIFKYRVVIVKSFQSTVSIAKSNRTASNCVTQSVL